MEPTGPGDDVGSGGAVRLVYELSLAGVGSGGRIVARRRGTGPALSESECAQLWPRLHALDQAIVRELRGQVAFGHVTDPSLARVLPLLLQRDARLGGERLVAAEEPLFPRARLEPSPGGGVRLEVGLGDAGGAWQQVAEGRLVVGNQAYFLRGHRVSPIQSPAAWELTGWTRRQVVELTAGITPHERDDLVRELTRVGVPAGDLARLAIRRGPPERIVALLLRSSKAEEQPVALWRVEADYGGTPVVIEGARPVQLYVTPADGFAGLIERDQFAEDAARAHLRRVHFHWEPSASAWITVGDAAVRSLDPAGETFPPDWRVARGSDAPAFHHDLWLGAQIRLDPERGLIDLEVDVAADDQAQVSLLLEIKDLLHWLESGRRYVELPDGSFVAPSPRFRQSLRILGDLGADAGRVTVSPLCVGLLRRLGDAAALAAADQATQQWLEELAAGASPQPMTPPAPVAAVLRDYQCRGLDWLAMLHRHRLTGILADDMGLGKTVQTLALLLWLREREGKMPSLVVAPTSVVTVWRDEAARFAPELAVGVWHGTPAERQALRVADYDLIVTSYGILRRDAERLAAYAFRYAIIDEAQSAKNAATQNARAIRRLKSQRRLALTGTPVENRPEELWAAFDFLAPGFLGTLRQFRKRYARPIARGEEEALALLRSRVQPLVLRRLKSEVARELPAKIETTVRCEMQPAQRLLYDHLAGELRQGVRRKIEQVGIERAQLDILAALTRLRQICADPALLPAPKGTKVPGSAKLELFGELMREALASERRVVVFSQFVEMQKRLIAVIRGLGVEPLWLHGGTRHRDKVVDAFQTPSGPPVIVVSLKAGGTGLTLTRADTVMHYDPWWNPAVERQATDRTHRLGQTQQVTVYRLVCARSIEERVLAMAERKDALAAELLGSEGHSGIKQITVADVMALLG